MVGASLPPTVVFPQNVSPGQPLSSAYQPAAVDYSGGLYGTLPALYPGGAAPVESNIPPASPARRRPWLLIGIAGVIVAMICAVIGYWALLQLPTKSEATETGWSETTSEATSEKGIAETAIVPQVTLTPVPSLIPTTMPPTNTATLVPTLPPTYPPSLTPTAPPTLSPTIEGYWQACPDIYLSRLHVGDSAYVSYDPPLANIVRNKPSKSASEVGRINPGDEVDILEGPQCANNMVWWLIRSKKTGLTGWTSEGDMDNYWLVPLP